MRWSAKFCAESMSVALVEASVSEMGRDFDVQVDGELRGRVSMLRSYGPGIAIGRTGALVWGGTRLYWIERQGTGISRFDMPEEVFAAFELFPPRWLLVLELSVGLWQPDRGVTSQADFGDVVAGIAWDKGGLLLRDFAGQEYRVDVAEDSLKLRRV